MTASKQSRTRLLPIAAAVLGATVGGALVPAQASSHREAPFIATQPKVDGTDFYMFRSYEASRSDFVTLIANYQPLQHPYGGPNYFSMDPNAQYEIHIDNTGDAKEDITFQFRFKNNLKSITLPIGGVDVAIPLIQAGGVSAPNAAALNLNETYTVDVVRGDRRGTKQSITKVGGGSATFDKPVDNIGAKTIADYNAYANQHIYSVNVPGCAQAAKLFVGQRKEAFAVNLGTIFDLVNAPVAFITNPVNKGLAPNTIDDSNVTTLALEVHKSCLTSDTAGTEPVIGGWTTASIRQGSLRTGSPETGHQMTEKAGGPWVQVSRLGMPLVNEVVIGLPDKDKFNGSKPTGDGQFLAYVTNPTLPRLLEIALGTNAGVIAPATPRTDLVAAFLTGIKGLNQTQAAPTPAEMLRLNTSIPPVAFASQNRLGVAGGDLAGFPNGRRPKDDVVDISLAAVAGALCLLNANDQFSLNTPIPSIPTLTNQCLPTNALATPLGATAVDLHDGVDQALVPLLSTFPYLFTPTPGSGNNVN